ncbi:MAG TPA: hypothetical protein VGM33_13540 [Baekduia sp.]|jgi:hypothetical protein
MSHQTATTAGTGSGTGTDKSIADVILQVLAAVGTGIGVLGFVIFVGGAVIWTRFDAVGVPAAEAVAVVPREVLVATGASVLAPAAALALLAVAGMFAWEWILDRDTTRTADLQQAKLEAAQRRCDQANTAAQDASAELTRLSEKMAGAVLEGDSTDRLLELIERAKSRKQTADAAATHLAEEERNLEELRLGQIKQLHQRQTVGLVVGAVLLFAASLGAALGWLGFNGVVGTLVVVLVALVTAAVPLLVHASTRKFAWLAATAFVGVGLTFAFAVYFDARGERQVVPAAVLLSDRAPVYGFLVAQRDDHVYIGTIDGKRPTDTHVVELDRAKVTDLLLDAHVRRDNVARDSWELAHRLCTTHGRDPAPPAGGTAVAVKAPIGGDAAGPTAADQLCSTGEIAALGAEPAS